MPKMRSPRAVLESKKTATAKRELRSLAAEVKAGEVNVERVREIKRIFDTRHEFLDKHPKTADQLRRAYVIALTALLENYSKVGLPDNEFKDEFKKLHELAAKLIDQKPKLDDSLMLPYYEAWNSYDPDQRPLADNSEPQAKAPKTEPVQQPINHHAEAVRLLNEAKNIPDSLEKRPKLEAVFNHLTKLEKHDNQTLDTLFTAGTLLMKNYSDILPKNLLAIKISEELNRFQGELTPENAKRAGQVFVGLSHYALSEERYTTAANYLLQAANFFSKIPEANRDPENMRLLNNIREQYLKAAKPTDTLAITITHYKDTLAIIAHPVFNPSPQDLRLAIDVTSKLRNMLSQTDNLGLISEISNAAQMLAKTPMLSEQSYFNSNDKDALAVLALSSAKLLLEVGKKEMAAKQLAKSEDHFREAVKVYKNAEPTLAQNPKAKNAVENFTQDIKDAIIKLKGLKSPLKKPRVHFADIDAALNLIENIENQITTAKLITNLGEKTKTAWKAALKTPAASPSAKPNPTPPPTISSPQNQTPTENSASAPKPIYPSQHRRK